MTLAIGGSFNTVSSIQYAACPLNSKASPTATMGLPVVLRMNAPLSLTLMVLPPGSEAVPRSSAPPVMEMAELPKPVDSWMMSSRRVRPPPVTRMVGALELLAKVECGR